MNSLIRMLGDEDVGQILNCDGTSHDAVFSLSLISSRRSSWAIGLPSPFAGSALFSDLL
jgi:hypothetical protein